jgi:hypothetical protein
MGGNAEEEKEENDVALDVNRDAIDLIPDVAGEAGDSGFPGYISVPELPEQEMVPQMADSTGFVEQELIAEILDLDRLAGLSPSDLEAVLSARLPPPDVFAEFPPSVPPGDGSEEEDLSAVFPPPESAAAALAERTLALAEIRRMLGSDPFAEFPDCAPTATFPDLALFAGPAPPDPPTGHLSDEDLVNLYLGQNDIGPFENLGLIPQSPDEGASPEDPVLQALRTLLAEMQCHEMVLRESWCAEAYSYFFVELCESDLLSHVSILVVCQCIGLLCSCSAAARSAFQHTSLFEFCVERMASREIQPVNTVCIVDEFLRSVYDPPLEMFDDVLSALDNAGTHSGTHSEAVAATLVTILDRPDSSDVMKHLLHLMSGLASRGGSDPLVQTLLILAEKVLVINGDYYDQLVDNGVLGFLWEILGRELNEKSSPIWPEMLSLMHCVITTLPEARGPFSFNAAQEIPPVDYMRSMVACGEPAQVAQWFGIFARLAPDAAEFQLLIAVSRLVFLEDAPFQLKVAWLTAWSDHAFGEYPVLFELFLRSGLLGEFSSFLDFRGPELEVYLGLILGILHSDCPTDSDCFVAAFFNCDPDDISVFDQLTQLLDSDLEDETADAGEESPILQQAQEIHEILKRCKPLEWV